MKAKEITVEPNYEGGLTIEEYLFSNFLYHPDMFAVKHGFLILSIIITAIILVRKFKKKETTKKTISIWVAFLIITILLYLIKIPYSIFSL